MCAAERKDKLSPCSYAKNKVKTKAISVIDFKLGKIPVIIGINLCYKYLVLYDL